MKCFIDMDGCLVNFTDAASRIHGFKPSLPHWDGVYGPEGWDITKKLNITISEWMKPFDRKFWRELDWFDFAGHEPSMWYRGKDLLQICEEVYKPENICLLSAPCMTPGCVEGKRDWIQKHMPRYKKQVLFGSCKEFCANADAVLFDDRDVNIEKFRDHGGTGILLPRPYNKGWKQWVRKVEHREPENIDKARLIAMLRIFNSMHR